MSIRRAQLVAEAVAVLCPHCGGAQLNKDGSEMWTAEDFAGNQLGRKACQDCDETILITMESRAKFL